VVQNAELWIELDNATWKPRRTMQIILLNDHLLVASRKKKRRLKELVLTKGKLQLSLLLTDVGLYSTLKWSI